MNTICPVPSVVMQFLESERLAHLATVNQSGHPHVVPICYAWWNNTLVTPIDSKPKRVRTLDLQRVRNIVRHPEVSVVVDRYREDWTKLGYVLIHGTATLWDPAHPDHPPAVGALEKRYSQYQEMNLATAVLIGIVPTRITTWGL